MASTAQIECQRLYVIAGRDFVKKLNFHTG